MAALTLWYNLFWNNRKRVKFSHRIQYNLLLLNNTGFRIKVQCLLINQSKWNLKGRKSSIVQCLLINKSKWNLEAIKWSRVQCHLINQSKWNLEGRKSSIVQCLLINQWKWNPERRKSSIVLKVYLFIIQLFRKRLGKTNMSPAPEIMSFNLRWIREIILFSTELSPLRNQFKIRRDRKTLITVQMR